MERTIEPESFNRVLVVEDDEMQRRMLTEMLQDEGFEVVSCGSASEALREFQKRQMSVAVLDLRLPDLSGVQLLDRLGEYAEHVSIIINTAYGSYESARDALNSGAFAYVEKAGDPEELLRQVHRGVAHQLRRRNERLEVSVSENQARLVSIFRAAPVGIGLLCGRMIMEVNEKLCEMTGYSRDELIGRNSRMLYLTQQEYDGVGTVECEPVGTHGLETRWQHKNGDMLHVRLTWTRLDPDDPAKGVTFTALDITQSKLAEARLVESEERYRSIFENAVLGLYRTTPDGRILVANPALVRMLGYDSFDELAQRDLERDESYAPDYPRSMFKEAVAHSGQIVGLEARWMRKDGHLLSVRENARIVRDERGQIRFYEGTVEDITEQREAERARRESERRYRAIVEDQTEFICRFTPDKRITFVNEAMCRFFGRSKEELLGEDFADFLPADEYRRLNKRLAALTPEQPIETHDNRGLIASGGEFWGRWTNRAIFDDTGTLVEFQAVGRDVTEQQRMLEALRQSEERYRLLIECAAQPVFTLSRDGVFLIMNRAAAAVLGGQPEDFQGKTLWDLFPKEVADSHMQDARRAIDSGHLIAVTRKSVIRGEERWYDARVQCIDDDAKRYALVILTDVTEAKRALEALRQNELLLRQAEQVAHVGSFSQDLLTNEITWSNETYRLFGYEPGEMAPSIDFFLSHIHPDDRDKFMKASDPQAGRYYDIEYRILRKDGQWRTVHSRARVEADESGRPLCRFGAVQDVTERHEAETALRDSETRFRELAELLPQTVFEIDTEGRFRFANRSACESFGYGQGHLTTLTVFQLFVADDHETLRQDLLDNLTGTAIADHVYTALRGDGTTFPVLLYTAPIIKDGVPAGLRGIALDITECQHAERALQESKAKLESVFESSPDAIIVVDTKGTIEDCNQAALEILGLASKEEILTHSPSEFAAPGHVVTVQDTLTRASYSGSIKNVELTLLRRPDSMFVSEISASVMTDATGVPLGVVVIATDITERKRAEELIRSERDRAQRYLDVAGVMFVALDREGKISLVNQRACEILGYRQEALLRADWFDTCLPARQRTEIRQIFADIMGGRLGTHERVENVVLCRDGQERLIAWHNTMLRDDSGAIQGTLSSGEDITERRRIQRLLQDREELLRETGRIAKIGGWEFDAQSLQGTWTDEVARIHDLESDAETNVQIGLSLYRGPSRQTLEAAIADAVARGKSYDLELELTTAKGNHKWVRTIGHPVKDGDRVVKVRGSCQDITDRKEAQERLLAYQAKLKSLASELSLAEERERRRIAADLHDHACQSLALSKMKLQAALDKSLPVDGHTLRQVCDGLNQTIENVRELTFDLSSPTLYKFGLEAALEELLRDKLKAEHRIRYHFSDDKRPKPLTPDVRVLLFQSVRELLINVIKHARAGEVRLDIRRENDSIRVTVTDDGVGFDADRIASSASRSRSVGLFNVQERLDYIGGRLEMDSQPGHGSRFALIAPLETKVHVAKESHDGTEDSAR